LSIATNKIDGLIGLKWSVAARSEGTAQIRFRLNGRQISISTGKRDPDALSKKEQGDLIARWVEAHGLKLPTPAGVVTLDQEIERFLTLQYEGASANTLREARRLLLQFRECLGVDKVSEVTKVLCEARKADMQAGRSPKYWKNFLTAAKKFCRWQVSEGHIPSDPLINFKNPSRRKFGRRSEVWTDERLDATLAQLGAMDREILLVLRWTGMDSSDLFQLSKSHVIKARDPDGRTFWKLYKQRAKAKSEEEVMDQPLNSRIEAIVLDRWEAQEDPKGKLWPMTYCDGESFADAFLRRLKAAQLRAGQDPPMDVKSLRGTWATYHAKRYIEGRGGPPMEELRRWGGWARDSRVPERLYIHAKASGRFMD
jgi:site-specific recombinase XerD